MPRAKPDQQRNALPQHTPAAEDKRDLTASSAPAARSSTRISLNEKGEFEISAAGSRKIEEAFLGSNTVYDSDHTDRTSLDNVRLAQVTATLPHPRGKWDTPEAFNVAVDGVATLAPRDGMEVMLCSQLVALHSQSMEFLHRGMLPDQTTEGVDCNVNQATKLLRSFATIAECLRTYRGGGQQKMTVEHVTVQSGGQAIVGTVNRGAGGGDAQQNGE